MAFDTRERTESVVLQFEDPIRMIEGRGNADERHRSLLARHRSVGQA
jgi:hypothetical protein